MRMNVSNDEPYVSICCKQDATYPPSARCYWNASLFTVLTIFPKILDPFVIPPAELKAMVPGRKIPCPSDTACYSDLDSENNISTYSFGNGTTSMHDSVYGDLTCRLDGREYCFKSRIPVGTENVTSICEAFFNWETSATYYRAQSSQNLQLTVGPMSITLLFLLATFVIYTIIPELRNLHGSIFRTYMLCFFAECLSTMLTFLFPTIGISNFISIFWHFAYLSTFSWLNVMSFDIWWTFRSLRCSSKQSPRKKYIIYSIYAWGLPMLVFGVGLIIEFLPDAPNGIIKPIHEGYWLFGSKETMVYLVIPLDIMAVFNILFFVSTAISITRQKKGMAECLEETDRRRYDDEKSRFYLYLWLFIAMAITRLESLIAILKPGAFPYFVSYILALPEMLAGLIIFILFVCNVRTRRILLKRLGLKDWRTGVIQWTKTATARIGAVAQQVFQSREYHLNH